MRALREQGPSGKALADLYDMFVLPRAIVAPNGRNAWLLQAVPFLFRVVSRPVAEELVSLHLRINAEVFRGEEEESKRSFSSLWEGLDRSYAENLNPAEREVFAELCDETDRAAFRILRALQEVANDKPFFLSSDHLEQRLARPGTVNGWRVLKAFLSGGVIVVVEKGQRRAAGSRGVATKYRWALCGEPEGAR